METHGDRFDPNKWQIDPSKFANGIWNSIVSSAEASPTPTASQAQTTAWPVPGFPLQLALCLSHIILPAGDAALVRQAGVSAAN
jgi:hypothetical protein